MQRALAVTLSGVVAVSAAGCAAKYRGRVTLEDTQEPAATVSPATGARPARTGTQPPDCAGELAMPEYPAELLGPGAPIVGVRVDLLLNDEGVPEDVVARLARVDEQNAPPASRRPVLADEEPPGATLFLQAAEAAVSQWRCRPAWRHPRPDEPPRWVPLPYRTWVLFRFDAERVDGKAALERKGGEDAAAGRWSLTPGLMSPVGSRWVCSSRPSPGREVEAVNKAEATGDALACVRPRPLGTVGG